MTLNGYLVTPPGLLQRLTPWGKSVLGVPGERQGEGSMGPAPESLGHYLLVCLNFFVVVLGFSLCLVDFFWSKPVFVVLGYSFANK